MQSRIKLIALLTLASLSLIGCNSTPPAPAMKYGTVDMQIKGKTYILEIADDEPTREFGLMKRTYLAPDRGMVFIYEKPDLYNFWMKNCFIDLDIIWLTPTGRVVTIATLKAGDETGASNEVPAQYIVELNAGTAKKIGLAIGDTIPIPPTIILKPTTATIPTTHANPRGNQV